MADFTKILPADIDTTADFTFGNISANGANVSLGAVANVHITGGTSGQLLSTDGSGNLSFTTVGSSTPHPFLFLGI